MPIASPQELAIGRMENLSEEAVAEVESFIRPTSVVSGTAQFAIVHLVAQSLADLKAGMHLAASGFLVQMYSVIRPVK